jgi:hypothetical protein
LAKKPGIRGFWWAAVAVTHGDSGEGRRCGRGIEVKYTKAAAIVAGSMIALGAAGAAPAFADSGTLPLGDGATKLLEAKDAITKTGLKAVTGKAGEVLGGVGKTGGTSPMVGGLPLGG